MDTPGNPREFREIIRYCFRCGSDRFPERAPNYFHCESCDYRFHINNILGVAGIIVNSDGKVLLIRRARDPGKGKFSIPGGFADPGETAETTLIREVREEVGLEVGRLRFLCSAPNPYVYHGVMLPVLDLIFVCEAESLEPLKAAEEEVEVFVWRDPFDIQPDELAFPSIRAALEAYRAQLSSDR